MCQSISPQAPIPVLVELRDYKAGEGFRGFILQNLQSHDQCLDEGHFKKLLQEGRLLLLVDGLNENPEAKSELNTFCRNVPLIATGRQDSDGWEIERKLELQPLSTEQVKCFFELRLPDADRAQVQALGDRVKDFGQTPLMVWMLYSIFRANKDVPETRSEAYRSFTTLYSERAKEGIDLSDARSLLGKLAFEMMRSKKVDDPTDFSLKILEVDAENVLGSGATLKRMLNHLLKQQGKAGNREISFCHQSLQEYYAAEYLLEQVKDLKPDRLQQDFLNYLKWTEPVALMLGLIKNDEDLAVRVVERALEVDLMLGARLAGSVQPKFQNGTIRLLYNSEFTPSLFMSLLEKSFSINAVPYLLDFLKSPDADNRWRAARALGEFSNREVIDSLVNVLADQDNSVRFKAIESLGKIRDVGSISYVYNLTNDSHWLVRSYVVEFLGEWNNSQTLIYLKKSLNHDDESIRGKAAKYLGKRDSQELIHCLQERISNNDLDKKRDIISLLIKAEIVDAIPIFIEALKEADWKIRSDAITGIGSCCISFGSQAKLIGVPALIESLKSDLESMVRSSAAMYLGMLNDSLAIPVLMNTLLNDENEIVCSTAATALGKLGAHNAVDDLIVALERGEYLCEAALSALRYLGVKKALPKMRKLVGSEKNDIRLNVIHNLGVLGNIEDFPVLYKLLKDKDFSVRLAAAYSLCLLRNRKGILTLEQSVKSGNKEARSLALKGFKIFDGKIGLESIISSAFEDEELFIRDDSITFLKDLGVCIKVEEKLEFVLKSNEEKICRNAMDAAKIIGCPLHLPRLRNLLKSIVAVDRPLDAIKAIQLRCGFYSYEIANYEIEQQAKLRKADRASLGGGGGDSHSEKIRDRSVVQNFYGTVYGVAGNVEGNQIISPPPDLLN